uniref:Lengsin n=1 Tax=Myripristis murdjan TaxID=586833 RepID=A0A668A393_9TELE
MQPNEKKKTKNKEAHGRIRDQIDGTGMSLGKRKGVRVTGKYVASSDWERGGPAIVHSYTSTPPTPDAPTVISIGPLPHKPTVTPEGGDYHKAEEEPPTSEDCTGQETASESRTSCVEMAIPRQTLDELKTILKESPLVNPRGKDEGKPGGRHGNGNPPGAFSTFKPLSDASRRGPTRDNMSIHLVSSMDSSSSFRPNVATNRQSQVRSPTNESTVAWGETGTSRSDDETESVDTSGTQGFISAMEQIKQQIARENISFVRFEATDLHGVSRSKTVPVRFFHEKAVYGVSMPRSYLELTLSPKCNEVDHANTANFSSDILLIPDLSTFRVLPWAEQTARVICDPCTVTGNPLRTSPRLIAKQLLGQLQSMGFSLHSSFTYECCVLGAPDRIGPKTLLFPATTLLSNHDLPFFQQLVDSMYCMGADVDSFASASGPGQMEINLRPEFGIEAADSAFTLRTSIKEMARKHSYIASFFTDDGLYNAGVLSHSLWDANGRRSLFHSGEKGDELSEIGRKWLAGLLTHSAALSCLMSPGLGCRSHIAKKVKDPKRMLYATCGCNDNSSSFNIKCHGGRETHIENKLGSAMANPYVVLAATVAAGLDGIKRNLNVETGLNKAPCQQKQFAIPVKLDDALEALAEDHVIRSTLGEPFVQYFIAMKKFEIETQELDDERNKCLEYFI